MNKFTVISIVALAGWLTLAGWVGLWAFVSGWCLGCAWRAASDDPVRRHRAWVQSRQAEDMD